MFIHKKNYIINVIDNYKEFAKDDFFWIFHSKKERDSFAFDSYYDEIILDVDYYPPPHPDYNGAYNPVAKKDAKDYLDGLKEINLDKAVSSWVPKFW